MISHPDQTAAAAATECHESAWAVSRKSFAFLLRYFVVLALCMAFSASSATSPVFSVDSYLNHGYCYCAVNIIIKKMSSLVVMVYTCSAHYEFLYHNFGIRAAKVFLKLFFFCVFHVCRSGLGDGPFLEMQKCGTNCIISSIFRLANEFSNGIYSYIHLFN